MEDEPQPEQVQQPVEAPTFKAPRMISRPKPQQQQEEEIGNDLNLGSFEGEQPLSISEARILITAVHDKRRKMAREGQGVLGDRTHNDTQSIQQFVDYLDIFARYKEYSNLTAMITVLEANPQINHAERAMLGSLCPDSADEAKTLIPSLTSKVDDETLEAALQELQKHQDRMS
ncbi:hypothetical protein BU23DRAFT_66596 [Bimuria novae-zelandiae CBS 107.79]|uniref:RNA polymerase Rpb4/RPC9 core domain-containing protein n=1 Tax=Bimuria novae-zelandiae CBS 107.79 TaxID=1447943 RepID=A0A6A5VIQ8_9PLEO|nr:hypothetical protein BU23DRAFT_66596 [Bimuria novae-zelandiae CBS 107.79]